MVPHVRSQTAKRILLMAYHEVKVTQIFWLTPPPKKKTCWKKILKQKNTHAIHKEHSSENLHGDKAPHGIAW